MPHLRLEPQVRCQLTRGGPMLQRSSLVFSSSHPLTASSVFTTYRRENIDFLDHRRLSTADRLIVFFNLSFRRFICRIFEKVQTDPVLLSRGTSFCCGDMRESCIQLREQLLTFFVREGNKVVPTQFR